MIFRKCNSSDSKIILNILRDSFESYKNVFNLDNSVFKNVFVVEFEGQVCGVVSLFTYKRLTGGVTGVIEDVAISGKYRRNKIGEFMINQSIKYLFEQGCFKIMAECKYELLGFYKKVGLINQPNSFLLKSFVND